MTRLTVPERIEAFKQAFPDNKAAWPWLVEEDGREVFYAFWRCGNDYRNASSYYGAYPRGYLPKLMALFPDLIGQPLAILHAFSGSLASGPYVRLDLRNDPAKGVVPDVVGSVYAAAQALRGRGPFDLQVADPPYSDEDAKRYESPMIDRLRTTEALADVATASGYLAWLDTSWPQHSKQQWRTIGHATVLRSTNHRVRLLTLFERTAIQQEVSHGKPEQSAIDWESGSGC